MDDAGPLVSVGVPVRNGGATLARVLDGLVDQSYRSLEIVICDNASTDDTEAIGRAFAARDSRVRYVRQPQLLPVLQNFRSAFEYARGELFMFAAHDDLRSPNYVETLVRAFRAHPEASLAASDVVEFQEYARAEREPRLAHDFETLGLGLVGRLRKHTRIGCDHVYGLINARFMREYRWYEDVGWDVAFLAYLAARGPFVYAPGATFYYRRTPAQPMESRARETALGHLRRFQRATTAWLTARAISDAHRDRGRWIPALLVFPTVFYFHMQGLRGMAAAMSPSIARKVVRHMRPFSG
jgi:glycosyltransferase involved in cell wall biosynthesis